MLSAIFIHIHEQFAQWPDVVLSGLLIVASIVIFCIALLKDHKLLKGIVLAYLALP